MYVTHCYSYTLILGPAAIADAIKNMGALLSLNLAGNEILSKESGRALADALKTNSVLTELDVSDNQDKYIDGIIKGTLDGAGFAKELVVGIKDNRAMTSLNLADNGIGGYYTRKGYSDEKFHPTPEGVCTQLPLLVPFLSLFPLFVGLAAVADAIKDMGALAKFDISNNGIQEDGTQALAKALEGNQSITELNVSSNSMSKNAQGFGGKMAGVTALADVIPGMGALCKFDISKNYIRAQGCKALATALKGHQGMTELNIASNHFGWKSYNDPDMSGIIALADAIPDMGALTSLNLSSNHLKAEGAKIFLEAMKVTNYAIASFGHHFHSHLTTG
jgi:Ran GTPase-activating protein (RanGAP) involved in mRNA processing and transport